ncbi:hypothetical protein [Paenibacillus polymyxa]|uniref:hypothetical protein n=1 Tax=Paenibacillus polymyxa TaxID=1406 RepID=UPI0039BC29B7
MTKIALVKHNGSQTPYAFYTDIELNKNDLVVCDTQKGYETGRVIKVANSVQGVKPTRWIVSKVDTKKHVERVEKEKRISELTQQINFRKIELNSLTSQHNKAISILIKELDELTNKNNTKKEIELKDSFYFKNIAGGEFFAVKHNEEYVVKSAFSPSVFNYFTVNQVRYWIRNGHWKVIG